MERGLGTRNNDEKLVKFWKINYEVDSMIKVLFV